MGQSPVVHYFKKNLRISIFFPLTDLFLGILSVDTAALGDEHYYGDAGHTYLVSLSLSLLSDVQQVAC